MTHLPFEGDWDWSDICSLKASTSYRPFLLGNDLLITKDSLESHQISEEFVLVGTGLMRSIILAMDLSANKSIIPKVILVDNSHLAESVWIKIKLFFEMFEEPDLDAFEELIIEMIDAKEIARDVSHHRKILGLIMNSSNYEFIRETIRQSKFILQDWTDKDIFLTLKAKFGTKSVVTYTSNIISYLVATGEIDKARSVTSSIGVLEPRLTICSNTRGRPGEFLPSENIGFDIEISRNIQLYLENLIHKEPKTVTSATDRPLIFFQSPHSSDVEKTENLKNRKKP